MFDSDEVKAIERLRMAHQRVLHEVRKNVDVQDRVIEEILSALFARGHCLLILEPGCAKGLLVWTLSRTLSLSSRRIQHTLDLLPSDVTGTLDSLGPLFANVILADDINYAPRNTQAVLFTAMQQRNVFIRGVAQSLEKPFFVMATQNPFPQDETYPLTETQLDHFRLSVHIPTPNLDDLDMLRRYSNRDQAIEMVLQPDEILEAQKLVQRTPVADHVLHYAARMVRSTRPGERTAPAFIKEWVSSGAGPRAFRSLISVARARAILCGQSQVSVADVQAVVSPVLRHRIVPHPTARSAGMTSDTILARLLESIPIDL